MTLLILGLIIFIGSHSTRLLADGWRTRMIARHGELRWKGAFSAVSLIGFGLLVRGYGQTRGAPVDLWFPPLWTRHLAALLTLPAMVLLAAAYVPRNRIKTRLGHPMLAGVALWAVAHLLANGRLSDALLFGAFALWAVLDFIGARRRDAAATRHPAGTPGRDALTLAIGLLAWAAFVWRLHLWLIGVAPLG